MRRVPVTCYKLLQQESEQSFDFDTGKYVYKEREDFDFDTGKYIPRERESFVAKMNIQPISTSGEKAGEEFEHLSSGISKKANYGFFTKDTRVDQNVVVEYRGDEYEVVVIRQYDKYVAPRPFTYGILLSKKGDLNA